MFFYKDALSNTYRLESKEQEASLPDGWVKIDEAEVTAIRQGRTLTTAPTALEQIRALEQAHDDDQRKLNRQGAIDTALTVACRNPAAASMTRDQVHAVYYAGNRGYRAMVDLEAQCTALRKLIV